MKILKTIFIDEKNDEGITVSNEYIEFSPNYYISKNLKVYSLSTKKYLKINSNLEVSYKIDGKSKTEKIQDIAARFFLPIEKDKKYVVFKDGNTNNRHISNLIRTSNKKEYFNRYEELIIDEEVLIDGVLELKKVKIRNAGEKGLFASEYSKIYSNRKGGLRSLTIYKRSGGFEYISTHEYIDVNFLVMRAFYPEQEEKKYVLFKDGKMRNKHHTNLVWSDEPELLSDSEGMGVYPGFSKYKFSKNGICKSYHTNYPKIIKPQMDYDGYFKFYLYNDEGKAYNLRRARILGTIFIPNPENLPEIDHRNQKRWDDRVENLKWSSKSDNGLNKNMEEMSKKISKPLLQFDLEGNFLNKFKNVKEAIAHVFENDGLIMKKDSLRSCLQRNNLIDEIEKSNKYTNYIWRYLHKKEKYVLKNGEETVPFVGKVGKKEADFPKYTFTKFGNLINKNGFLLSKHVRNGYPCYSVCNKNFKIHICVGTFFVPGRTEEKKWINHIDENKLNFQPENLEWVTPRENGLHSAHKSMKQVDQFDINNGEFIKRFPSVKSASESVGCSTDSVGYVCRNNRGTVYGYAWRFADLSTDKPKPIILEKKSNNRSVNQYKIDGTFLRTYKSVKEAIQITKISGISGCCRGAKKTAGGFRWKYDDLNN